MELSTGQQIFEQIKKSNKILIFLPKNLTADFLAAGLALKLFLEKLKKDVLVLSSGQVPQSLAFLPKSLELKNTLPKANSLVVSLNTKQKKLEEISYQTAEDKVNIYLKSADEEFTPEDITFSKEKFPVDLLFILGARSLENLGEIYEANPALFFETPKINIDSSAANEYFGSINLVDITATSVAEMLADLFKSYEQQLIDEDIATCLLAGIISNTSSFQHAKTTPKSFFQASELVAFGGRQQEIIKNIYKTKSLPLLKLWGRALAKMKLFQDLVYVSLVASDFERSAASESEALPVLYELLESLWEQNIFLLAVESQKNQPRLFLAVRKQADTRFITDVFKTLRPLDSYGEHCNILELEAGGKNLDRLEQEALALIKQPLKI